MTVVVKVVDLEDIGEDKRYKSAKREALYSIILTLLYFVWWYWFAYGMGSKPLSGYKFVMGLPSWFFWSCVVGFIVFSFASWFLVKFFFQDMSLETDGRDDLKVR